MGCPICNDKYIDCQYHNVTDKKKLGEAPQDSSPLDDMVSLQFVLQEERRKGEWTDIYTADDGDAGEMILGIHKKKAKWPLRLIERRETFIAN